MPAGKYPYYLASIIKLVTGVKPWLQVVQVFLRQAPPGVRTIELRQTGIRFKTRGALDIWSVKETFLDRFYEKFGVPIKNGWTVVDIGGGIGDFSIFAACRYPQNSVFAFEPTPESFALLQENLRLNGIENVHAFPEAIWSENGRLAINTSIGEPGQFTSQPVEGTPPADGQVIVPGISLAEVFSRLSLTHCDLMKMDCEGAEFSILFNTPDEVLERIERIVMEYHDSHPPHTHEELAEFLSKKGYRVETFQNYVHADLGYLRATRSSNG